MIMHALSPRTTALALLALLPGLSSTVFGASPREAGTVLAASGEIDAGLEVGSLPTAQPNSGTWHTVTFQQAHNSPVVVFGPVPGSDDPAMVRVRNVTSTGFEYQISEWDYQDGARPGEVVNYVVIEEGSHTIGGLRWQAGRVSGVTHLPATFEFSEAFAADPVVLAQVASRNGPAAVVERLRDITVSGFTVQLDEEEAADGSHAEEDLHFIAIEPGSGQLESNGRLLEVGRSSNNVSSTPRRLNFSRTQAAPFLMGDLQTRHGADPVVPRFANLDSSGVDAVAQEETSAEPETSHTNEVMGYFVLGSASDSDSDGDGIPDDYENAWGLDPYNSADAGYDYDGDGISNLDEYRYGTNPYNFDSAGTITVEALTPNGFEQEAAPAHFRINRTGGNVPVTVYFTLGGGATPPDGAGADYRVKDEAGNTLSGAIQIGFDSTSAIIVIEPVADSVPEYPEQAALTIAASGLYTVGEGGGTAGVTIADATDTPANEQLFVAFLSAQGAVRTYASGIATLFLNGPKTYARVSLSFSGLTSGQTNAYIRYGITSGVGPELRPTFPNGQVTDQPWSIVPVGVYSGQDVINGLFQVAGAYVYTNIGTAQYPAGEISGIWSRQSGSTTFTPPADPPPIDPLEGDALTRDVARFLTQATFGPTQQDIEALVADINNYYGGDRIAGFSAWIDQQFAMDQTSLYQYTYFADQEEWALLGSNPINYVALARGEPRYFNRRRGWWAIAARAQDQLRQRVAFALSQIFVISEFDATIQQYHYGAAIYYDQLGAHATGTFRALLGTISRSPMMGRYLSHLKNQKAIPGVVQPDENYARESMQLFSIGLVHRHLDGSLVLGSDGLPIPTYNNTDITELARVYTGWSFSMSAGAQAQGYPPVVNNNFNAANGPRYYQHSWTNPMKSFPAFHDTGAKTVLGTTINAGLNGDQDLNAALNILANHPNAAPFISRLLIQRLVTSNPSAGYIYRVAQKFQNNGGGVRGDFREVVRAILLDYEARSLELTAAVGYGKQKEPIIRYLQLIRAVNGASQLPVSNLANYGYPASQLDNFPAGTTRYRYNGTEGPLGQIPLRPPTVFNWFPWDFSPGGLVAIAGLLVPEFKLNDETRVVSAINYHYTLATIDLGQGVDALVGQTDANLDNVRLDRTSLVQLYDSQIAAGRTVAQATATVLDHMDVLLLSGNLRAKYEFAAIPNPRRSILNAVSTMTGINSLTRVKELLYLVVTSPEYIHQK